MDTQASSWVYKPNSGTGSDDGPMALYGEPDTLASIVFACDAEDGTLEIAFPDEEPFEGSRRIVIAVGKVGWSGFERMDPSDAIASSRAEVPLAHPLVDAMA